MKPVLRQVYEYLRNSDKVKNQLAFAKSLKPDSAPEGLNDSYVSRLMRSKDPLPKKIVWAVHEAWGVSYEWLASSGISRWAAHKRTNRRCICHWINSRALIA